MYSYEIKNSIFVWPLTNATYPLAFSMDILFVVFQGCCHTGFKGALITIQILIAMVPFYMSLECTSITILKKTGITLLVLYFFVHRFYLHLEMLFFATFMFTIWAMKAFNFVMHKPNMLL